MPSREQSLDVIATFLRERNAQAEQTLTALKNLPPEQRAAVMAKGDIANDCQRHFTINELVSKLPGDKWLDYAKLRYVLLGADEGVYRKQGQPKALSLKGIVIDYSDGKRKPKFCYDRDIHLAALNNTVAPVEVVKEEEAAPAVSVTEKITPEVKEEPEIKYVRVENWLRNAVSNAINVNELRAGKDNVVYVNDSPLYGIFYASVEWMEANGYPVDVTKDTIMYDTAYAISEDTD